jgi:hypothetical protein
LSCSIPDIELNVAQVLYRVSGMVGVDRAVLDLPC